MDNKFPQIKREIMNFIEDEEGNITRGKMLTVGSLVVLMGLIAGIDAYAKHSSHKSHSSHSSTSYHRSHVSHTSHRSSTGHSSHSSHSNTHSSHSSHSSHSNTHSSHASGLIDTETTNSVTSIPTIESTTEIFDSNINDGTTNYTDITNPNIFDTTNSTGQDIDFSGSNNGGLESEEFSEIISFQKGDVNTDGVITASDARLALRMSAKLEISSELQQELADIDNNDIVTAADARTILRKAAKLE